MKFWPASALTGTLAVTFVLSGAVAYAQEGDLAAARELYASASYDDALVVLNKLRVSERTPGQSRAISPFTSAPSSTRTSSGLISFAS